MCGIFGVYGDDNAPYLVYCGIWNLQHRGGESAGIASYDGCDISARVKKGTVAEVFRDTSKTAGLEGHLAIGHVRYPTSGSTTDTESDGQPLIFTHDGHKIVIGVNGHIWNAEPLRRKLEGRGAIFKTSSDSELILHLALTSLADSMEEKLINAFQQVKGSYSFLMMYDDTMYAARDPNGYRPLCMGLLGEAVLFSSESIAFENIGAQYVDELRRGELVKVDQNGIEKFEISYSQPCFNCIMELLYFANPGSKLFGNDVMNQIVRNRFGHRMGLENPGLDCDILVAVPESGCDAAEGLHEETGIPLKRGIIKNRNSGRTFLPPRQAARQYAVNRKYIYIDPVLKGMMVGEVDDTVIRATTSGTLVRKSKDHGAKGVYFIASSPPYIAPCFWGIDTPTKKELIAAQFPAEERVVGVQKHIGADKMIYLSHDGMVSCVPESEGLCTRCFTDEYPEDLVAMLHDLERLDCR